MRFAFVVVIGSIVIACGGKEGETPPPVAPRAAEPKCETAPIATTAASSAVPVLPSHATESCGELAMTRAALLAEGRGKAHPEVRGVDALLTKCTDKTPSAETCRLVENQLVELRGRGTYGPNHPTVLGLEAKKSLCGS